MQIKDDPSLKWPKMMKRYPNKQNKSKYCHFHQNYGHDTDKCYDLKQQIKVLIKQGKYHKDEKWPIKGKAEESLRQPLGEIRIIIGGPSTRSSSKAKKTYLRVVQNVRSSRQPLRMVREDEPTIIFPDEDARRLHHPHGDAIVINLAIANYTTRRMLIDNGSLADILYYPAF